MRKIQVMAAHHLLQRTRQRMLLLFHQRILLLIRKRNLLLTRPQTLLRPPHPTLVQTRVWQRLVNGRATVFRTVSVQSVRMAISGGRVTRMAFVSALKKVKIMVAIALARMSFGTDVAAKVLLGRHAVRLDQSVIIKVNGTASAS